MQSNYWPLALAFITGFLSLSQQIIWVRLIGFFNYGKPEVFSAILAAFLAGIAAGAWLGRWCCLRQFALYPLSAFLLIFIGISDLLLPETFASIYQSNLNNQFFYLLIFMCAAGKAVIFPIAHHLFTQTGSVTLGRSLSKIYFSNIAGSFFGPILTGFILLDYWSALTLFRFTGLLEIMIGSLLLCWLWPSRMLTYLFLLPISVLSALIFQQGAQLTAILEDELLPPVNFLRENRQGIIHTRYDGVGGDWVFGGNVYDGRINLRLDINSNKIDRVFLAAALSNKPKRVLVIGLSAGSWVRIISALESIEKLDVVELNPAYLELMDQHLELQPILSDPKVSIHIADGRKWLQQATNTKPYDLIIMNSTFHWRAYSTNLLSIEMMRILSQHLTEQGLLAFNATGSANAHWTAAQQFSHTYRWSNFIYAAEHDFIINTDQIAERIISLYSSENWPYEQLELKALQSIFSQYQFIDIEEEITMQQRKLKLITDDNMLPEYQPEN